MREPDYAHKMTDKQLAKLEYRITQVYIQARDDLNEKVTTFFENFKKQEDQKLKLVKSGKMTEAEFKQWRLNKMASGKRYEALRDKVAQRLTDANVLAASYINGELPWIYALNRNYAAYTVESVAENVNFTLWNEDAVKRLIVEQPDLLPSYPPERAVNRKIDVKYGQKQVKSQITSGILQGESVPQIAKRIMNNIPDMDRTAAIRAARTAATGAQNAGRLDNYKEAEALGIELEKEWMATLDSRTRESHARLDGTHVKTNQEFDNGLMYPGDPDGAPEEVYNCRCTMVAYLPKYSSGSTQRKTYSEWKQEKIDKYGEEQFEKEIKKYRNISSDKKQYYSYKERLGSQAPKSFKEFQNLKYGDGNNYKELVDLFRYKGRVPEATMKDFELYMKVKETGIFGTIRVPPYKIDSSILELNDEHALGHGGTLVDAKKYVENAFFSIRRKKWDGLHTNYYSFYGAAYIRDEDMKVKTIFPRSSFDHITKKVVEVFE